MSHALEGLLGLPQVRTGDLSGGLSADKFLTTTGASTQGYPLLFDANGNAIAATKYSADSGTANTYVVTLTAPPASYYAGFEVAVKIAHANTGASTVNVSSLGAATIKKESSSGLVDLAAGDLQVGQVVYLIYDGTYFQWVSGPGAAYYQTVEANSTPVTQRAKLNVVGGSNVTVTATDNGTDTTTLTLRAGAAPSPLFVQGAGNGSTSAASVSTAFTSANTAGNCLVIDVAASGTPFGSTTPTITDTLGNTWTLVFSYSQGSGGEPYIAQYIAMNCRGGANTVTASYGGACYGMLLLVHEYSGMPASAVFDASFYTDSGIIGGSATNLPLSVTTTADYDLLHVFSGANTGSTSYTDSAGYTVRETFTGSGGFIGSGRSFDFQASAAGTYSDTITVPTTVNGFAVVIALKASAVPLGSVTSIGLTMPTEFSVSGSPVTGAGTISVAKANQSANQVYAGPSSGAAAAPTFRALVPADLPVGSASALGALRVDGTTITASGGVISASGGGSFYTVDPAGVSGLYALYYAGQGVYKDLGVTLASAGDLIEQWNDQSGNGHHLIQATSGKRPTYQTTGGPPGLTNRTVWAGGQCLQLASAAISTFTIFTIMRGNPGSTAGMLYEQSANASAGSGLFMYGSVGSTILASRSAVLSARNDTTNWSVVGEWYLLNHVYRGTHATHTWGFNTVLSNGLGTDGTASSDPGSSTVTDTLNLGARNNAASLGFTGDIIAVVIFTPAISTQNIQGITNFLMNKYNI